MSTSVAELEQPVWRIAVASFLPPNARESALSSWIPHIPVALIVLLQLWTAVRLQNTTFEDEALYIDAGRDYIQNWLHGTPVQHYGDYFSGAPAVFPVFQGAVNAIGGLLFVRLTSAFFMIAAALSVRATVTHLWGKTAGNLSALVFVGIGPVMFVGNLATYDAACISMIAMAVWLGVARNTWRSAAIGGVLLALAAVFKYTGVIFIPVVLALMLVTARSHYARSLITGGVAVGLLGSAYYLFGSSVQRGIEFTTSSRETLFPQATSTLVGWLISDLGPVLALAAAGALLTIRSPRSFLLASVLVGGGLALPAAQLLISEGASFEKHLSYGAVFLAPLAARALLAIRQNWKLGTVTVIIVVTVLGLTGLSRSHAMYQWPSVSRVVELVEADPRPGHYLSTSFQELHYYMYDNPSITWDSHFAFFSAREEDQRNDIAKGVFQMVALRTGDSGNAEENRRTAFVINLLENSPNYDLAAKPFPTRPYSTDAWLVYRLTDAN
jgi:hypothetical protein